MSEKKLTRKEMRKAERKRKEIEKKENSLDFESEADNFLKKNQASLKDLLAPSGIDCTHFDYLEIFSKFAGFVKTTCVFRGNDKNK